MQGSFGQVVCAYDQERKTEVAIKIIKSRKPFLIQAKTEIDILNKVNEKDEGDDSNIVRLLDTMTPARVDGQRLLAFPRLFIVAQRRDR